MVVEGKLSVPVIEISSLLNNGASKKKTIQEIGKACQEWGFFYIVGHQISLDFIDKTYQNARAFFAQPKQEKMKVARKEKNWRGFSDSEFTKQKVDWKEVFDFGSELIDRNERKLDVEGENQWPEKLPEFKMVMLKYFDEMHFLAEKLMSAIFSSLGEDPESHKMDFLGSRDSSVLRLNYYPSCPFPNANLGVGPHSDPSSLTILYQDMDVNSLQVQKDGKFYDVTPVPGSFVVNIGDMVQVWSNGIYKAPVHRVLANHDNVRYSLPFFYTPSYSCNIKPLNCCISEENPQKYTPINWGEFRNRRYYGDYADVGEEIQITHYLVSKENA